jgi:RNA polymerase sigma-70 factor (ECF subfamily)
MSEQYAGRDEHFEAVYRRYYARVYRFYRSLGVADDEAHDLAQDAFKRFYEQMHLFRGGPESEWPFLRQLARNVLLNWIRARKAVKRDTKLVDLDDENFIEEPPEAPDYAEKEQQTLRRKRLAEALRGLPEGQQQCIRLWVQGHKYNEIAELLRISVDAVKSRLRDAKKYLRSRLGEEQ